MSMRPHRPPWCQDADAGYGMELLRCAAVRISCSCTLPPWSVRTGQKLFLSHQAEIAQLAARRSPSPKVVSLILLFRMAWR